MNQTQPDDPGQKPDTTTEPTKERTVEIPSHEQELARLREERDQLEQQLQRQLADAANVRRRQRQEMDDQKKRVIEGLTQELLPALDSFAMALAAFDGGTADAKSLVDGVRMTKVLLCGALERHGLQEIKADGQVFDPLRHEAVAVEPTTQVPEGQVVRVLQTGYQIADRVVRHARVVVAGPQPKS
ncbi:MAG: nucleotide exchange factor GrpE [Planctomycetes bacterium]|nr:nucleotide exchange factor GrpE [Planctomycetota bacterium]